MPRHDETVRLAHMPRHAEEAVEMASGLSALDLHRDRRTQLALIHLVGIIGEAANRVSPQAAAGIAEVPWPLVVGMRNRLFHGYDKVDLEVLERTIREDLPPMIDALRSALKRLENSRPTS